MGDDAVATCCETARDGRYSGERERALDRLSGLYVDATDADQERILRTLSTVARNAMRSTERQTARETLVDLMADSPRAAAAVETLRTIATGDRRGRDRLDALNALARVADETADPGVRESVRDALTEVATEATRRRERERAQDLLHTLDADGTPSSSGSESGGDAYLAQSLAEHLAAAADDGRPSAPERAGELREFVAEHSVDRVRLTHLPRGCVRYC